MHEHASRNKLNFVDKQAGKLPKMELHHRLVRKMHTHLKDKGSNAIFFKKFIGVIQQSLIRELFTASEVYRKPDI